MDKDKQTEDLRDLTPEKDAKGGLREIDVSGRPRKSDNAPDPTPIQVPPMPAPGKDPYTKSK